MGKIYCGLYDENQKTGTATWFLEADTNIGRYYVLVLEARKEFCNCSHRNSIPQHERGRKYDTVR